MAIIQINEILCSNQNPFFVGDNRHTVFGVFDNSDLMKDLSVSIGIVS
jgi:hypothetical protein